ncbi:hypothetical protein FQA39_LY13956 [Lamprigera yunnana]|nr:hypothetical protein FQA39_LY13956 [Lamprigera yunnana]
MLTRGTFRLLRVLISHKRTCRFLLKVTGVWNRRGLIWDVKNWLFNFGKRKLVNWNCVENGVTYWNFWENGIVTLNGIFEEDKSSLFCGCWIRNVDIKEEKCVFGAKQSKISNKYPMNEGPQVDLKALFILRSSKDSLEELHQCMVLNQNRMQQLTPESEASSSEGDEHPPADQSTPSSKRKRRKRDGTRRTSNKQSAPNKTPENIDSPLPPSSLEIDFSSDSDDEAPSPIPPKTIL